MEKLDLALDQLHKAKKQASEVETNLKKINCTTDKNSEIFTRPAEALRPLTTFSGR